MRKLLLLLTVVMMLGLVGCSGKDEEKNGSDTTQTPAVTTQAPQKDDQGLEVTTLATLLDLGYTFRGYSKSMGSYTINLEAPEVTPDMAKLAENLEGKTVRELRDEYDMTISYSSFGDEYTLETTIGTITYEFEIEHGVQALKENEEESFYDLERDDSVQDDELKNVKVTVVAYNVTLEEASEKYLNADEENVSMSYMEDNAEKLMIKEYKYELN